MLLAFTAAAVAIVALVADVLAPRAARRWPVGARPWSRHRVASSGDVSGGAGGRGRDAQVLQDPGRERRAEQKARALLRSCVNQEEWEMYRDLGFLRVWSGIAEQGDERCAYLLYAHRPIVAYLPDTRRLVGEYCVNFDDPSRPYGSGRLPDSDDVLAKWMALTGDERNLISMANMHLPGRQVDAGQVQQDLQRLAQWDQDRARRPAHQASSGRAQATPSSADGLAHSAG